VEIARYNNGELIKSVAQDRAFCKEESKELTGHRRGSLACSGIAQFLPRRNR